MNLPSDAELNERLTEVVGFVPCDKWAHIRASLRKGKVYFVYAVKGKPYPVLIQSVNHPLTAWGGMESTGWTAKSWPSPNSNIQNN